MFLEMSFLLFPHFSSNLVANFTLLIINPPCTSEETLLETAPPVTGKGSIRLAVSLYLQENLDPETTTANKNMYGRPQSLLILEKALSVNRKMHEFFLKADKYSWGSSNSERGSGLITRVWGLWKGVRGEGGGVYGSEENNNFGPIPFGPIGM